MSQREASTAVEIYSDDNNEWYCRVSRREQKTRRMGRYAELTAEKIQDVLRTRIAAKDTAWLVFEKTGENENEEERRK